MREEEAVCVLVTEPRVKSPQLVTNFRRNKETLEKLRKEQAVVVLEEEEEENEKHQNVEGIELNLDSMDPVVRCVPTVICPWMAHIFFT